MDFRIELGTGSQGVEFSERIIGISPALDAEQEMELTLSDFTASGSFLAQVGEACTKDRPYTELDLRIPEASIADNALLTTARNIAGTLAAFGYSVQLDETIQDLDTQPRLFME